MLDPYRPAIRAGVPQAMFDLGREREANGCRDWWAVWVRRAAVAGHEPATEMLREVDGAEARWYWEDLPTARDDPLYRQAQELEAAGEAFDAERTYRKAANAGNAHAAYRLGRLLKRHRREGAREWLERAEAGGDRFAGLLCSRTSSHRDDAGHRFVVDMASSGDLDAAYVVGQGTDDAAWLRDAARAGDADAAYELARQLEGVAARRWLRLAALAGHPRAATGEAVGSVGLDLQAARERWRRAAADGDVDALFNLAIDAERVGDTEEANRLFRDAVAGGDAEAAARLAALRATAGDRDEAEMLVRHLAESDVAAACMLGVLRYDDGDLEAAWELWHPRASAGHIEPAYHLGLFYELDDDPVEALRWYGQAADAGHSLAARRSGDLLLTHLPWEDARPYWELLRRGDRCRSPVWMAESADLARRYRLPVASTPRRQGAVDSQPRGINTSLSRLLVLWDELVCLAPTRRRAVEFLASSSRVPHGKIDQARRVRNRCAHPNENGWPTPDEIARAIDTLRAVRRAVRPGAADDEMTAADAVARPSGQRSKRTMTLGFSSAWAASPPTAVAPSRRRTRPLARKVTQKVTQVHDRFFDGIADRREQILAGLAVAFAVTLLLSGVLLWQRAPGGQAIGVVLFGLTTAALVLSTVEFYVGRLEVRGLRMDWDWDWEDAGLAAACHLLWLVALWTAAVPFLRVGWVDAWMLVSLPFVLVPYVAWSRILLTGLGPVLVVAALAAPLLVLGSAEAVTGAPAGPLGLPADLVDDGTFDRD